ncbi:MAG TPA: hypothetical protein VFV31_14125 [Chitinophagaceae bacterium]|nr:hypothetical protein [Chitinophagaceae bacterium]
METHNRPRPVLSQTQNNTTLWIGHMQTDPHDYLAGQTFVCPAAGTLDNIQVFAAAVQNPGEVELTLHVFDPANKTWGPALSRSNLKVQKGEDSRWIRFETPAVELEKGTTYGFRLHTPDALVALGEAVSHAHKPFTFGQSWNAHDEGGTGHYSTYFSLAFKVELCA